MAVKGVTKKTAHFSGSVKIRTRNLSGTNFSTRIVGPKAKGR